MRVGDNNIGIGGIKPSAKSFGLGEMSFSSPSVPTEVLEDWSSGNLDDYGGDTGQFSVQSTDSILGSNSVEASGAINDEYLILKDSKSFSPGITFQARVYTDYRYRPGLLFGFQSPDKNTVGYWVGFESGGSSRRQSIRKWDNGSDTNLAQTDQGSSPANEWRYDRVYWGDDGTIKYVVYNQSGDTKYQVETTNTDIQSPGYFGWTISGANNGGDIYRGDAFRILGEGDLTDTDL